MTDDIVARLRDLHSFEEGVEELAENAADDIKRLRGLLRWWLSCGCPLCGGDCSIDVSGVSCCIVRETRAAIAGEKAND